MVIVLFRKALN